MAKPPPTIAVFLQSKNDNAPALYNQHSGSWMDYGELATKISASKLVFNNSIKKLILGLIPRTAEGVIAYLAAAASGHAVLLVEPQAARLHDLIGIYKPDWVMGQTSPIDGYEPVEWPLTSLQLQHRCEDNNPAIHPDLFLLLLTSGSTGSQKAVRLSYNNIASNTNAIVDSLGLTTATRAIIHLPLSYSFGLSVLHSQLAVGGSCLLTEQSMMNREFWQLARDEKANLFSGVPYHYEMLQRLDLMKLQVPELKIFLQAGGKLSDELTRNFLQQIQQRQGQFYIMYGQTEAGPRMTCLPLHSNPEKIGSVGCPISGGNIYLQDDEIVFKGPNVMMGYAMTCADLALGDTQNGTLYTGDIGQIDQSGYVTITGRQQRFAKLFGERIALDELERLATKIAPTFAFATTDRLVLMTPAQDAKIVAQIKDHLIATTRLPPAWFEIKSITDVPYQASGKADYAKMRAWL